MSFKYYSIADKKPLQSICRPPRSNFSSVTLFLFECGLYIEPVNFKVAGEQKNDDKKHNAVVRVFV